MSATCPYHSTLENGMRLFGPTHPCFTVYDQPPTSELTPDAQTRETERSA